MSDALPRVRCYVASPFGFTEAGRFYYREIFLPALALVVDSVDPWSLTGADEVSAAIRAGREAEMAREIGRRNIAAIRASDLLVACLDGQEVDAGTAAEVGFAAALGRPCFGVRTDLRQTGESGATVNLQVEAFILASGGSIAGTLAELVDDLRAHLTR
jgi:nucleoside 2-deoxyribosyltransferase